MRRLPEVLLGVALIAATGCSSTSGSSTSVAVPHPTSAANILTKLGVSAYSSPPAATVTNAAGTTTTIDTSSWQPLKKLHTVFSPRAELFEAGAAAITASGNDIDSGYWEDSGASYQLATTAPFPSSTDQTIMANSAKVAVAADLDGDGIAELVLFYVKSATDTNLYYRVRQKGVFGSEQAVSGVTLSGKSFSHQEGYRYGIGSAWFPYLSAAKADLSGTGTDSLLVADYETVYVIAATLNPSSSGSSGWTLAATATQAFGTPVTGIAAGDVDGDGKDEIAVGLLTWNSSNTPIGEYALYSGAFATTLQPVTILSETNAGSSEIANGPVEPAFGCLDGSHRDQLILATKYVDGTGRVYIYQMDPVARSLGAPVATLAVLDNYLGDTNGGTADYYRMLPRAVDLKGTGAAALEVLGQIFYAPLQAAPTTAPDARLQDYSTAFYGYNTLVDVQVGDIDEDGKQDLIYLAAGQGGQAIIKAYGLLASGGLVEKGGYEIDTAAQIGDNNFGMTTAIAAGNFEDNAARVHYQGHKLTFTDPIVIAVLASPPFWADLASSNANYSSSIGNWTTTFGETTGASSGTSTAVGFSVGASIDYEQDINLPVFGTKVGEFKASIGFTNTNNWEWSADREVTKSVTYSATAGQDNVIFTSVPVDEYQYVIDYSPDPANAVGKSIYITIPRDFSTYTVERGFFNQNTDPTMTAPIDSSVLGHTLGLPATYPTVGDKDTAMAASFGVTNTGAIGDYQYGGSDGTGTTVSESDNMSNGTALEISVNNTSTTTVTHDFSVEASAGFLLGDVGATVSAGFQAGYAATSSTSAGTTFGGTVGSIPSAKWGTPYEYKSGLFARPFTNSFGRKFWVVDYWVTPL